MCILQISHFLWRSFDFKYSRSSIESLQASWKSNALYFPSPSPWLYLAELTYREPTLTPNSLKVNQNSKGQRATLGQSSDSQLNFQNSRRRPVRAILHVSGDGLRVVEDETKGLIVDQTIEKVSFCAPDRNHEKGFSYICRDGTTRRWMCHGFLALKESVSQIPFHPTWRGSSLIQGVPCSIDKECIKINSGIENIYAANLYKTHM